MPWDDRQANPHLTQWAPAAVARGVAGPGRRTLVVGCGICDDPVFLAGLGCEVTAFDVSPTAVAEASRRFAGDLPGGRPARLATRLAGTFDLVAEFYTVQACTARPGRPRSGRSRAWWRPAARCW